MRSVKLAIVSASVALFMLAAYITQSGKGSTETVQMKIDQGALVVDVRTPAEFEDWHFEGAVNISVDAIDQRLEEFGPKEQAIVVYCRSGRRSGIAKSTLEAAGYIDVTNAGGLDDMAKLKR